MYDGFLHDERGICLDLEAQGGKEKETVDEKAGVQTKTSRSSHKYEGLRWRRRVAS